MTRSVSREEFAEKVHQEYMEHSGPPPAMRTFMWSGTAISVIAAVGHVLNGGGAEALLVLLSGIVLTLFLPGITPLGEWMMRRGVAKQLEKSGTGYLPAWTAVDPNFPSARTYLARAELTTVQRECAEALAEEHEGTLEDLVVAARLLVP